MEKSESGKGFTICSWNINGIRTLDMKEVLNKLNAQIVAVQETKVSRDQLDEKNAFIPDFSSFFAFSRNRNGYSGVATYCDKIFTPVKAEEGLSGLSQSNPSDDAVLDSHELFEDEKSLAKYGDSDGRCFITQHLVQTPKGEKPLTIFNVYCPRLRDDPSDPVNNKEFKKLFHSLLERRAKQLCATSLVLIVGDLNISHKPIDVSDDVESPTFMENTFRQHLDELLSLQNPESSFRDTFRLLHPDQEKAFTCWCTRTNARQNNYGTRIDYIIASIELAQYLDKADIHSDITGSDHCPISATFHSLTPVPNSKHPSLSTKFYPEFSGKQQKLKEFLSRSLATNNSKNSGENVNLIQNNSRKRASPSTKGKQMNLTSFFTKIPRLNTFETDSTSQQNFTVKKSQNLDNDNLNFASNSRNFTNIGKQMNDDATNAWKKILKGPDVPLCPGHSEPCTLRTVKKKGSNQGRQFWSCAKGIGSNLDPNASCNYFQWAVNTKTSKLFPIKNVNDNRTPVPRVEEQS